MNQITFPHKHIILDACCIINIYASGRHRDIFCSLGASLTIADYVYEREIKFARNSRDDTKLSQSVIDLDPLISCGLLSITSPESDDEKEAFVNLAYAMKDGDAVTGAIAITRNFTLATDDRRAIAYLRQLAPQLAVVSTLDILKHWVDMTNPPAHDIRQAIQNIRIQASYAPGPNHPLHAWWQIFA